jgi:hypothetical protein
MDKKDVNNIFEQKILNIGARLKEARINAGFRSARAFALAHDIRPRTYQNHENGDFEAAITTLIKYSQLLNSSYVWLINGTVSHKNRPYHNDDVDGWFSPAGELISRMQNRTKKLDSE